MIAPDGRRGSKGWRRASAEWDRLLGGYTTIRKSRLRNELARLQRRDALLLQAIGEGVFGLDRQGKTTFLNPAAARILGYSIEDALGRPMHSLLHHSKPDGRPYPEEECPVYAALTDGVAHRVADEVFWRKDGTAVPVEYVSTPIHEGEDIVGAVVTFRDITERLQAEQALRHQAMHDALTGLPNRALLRDRLEQALREAEREDYPVALLVLDLDGFKDINDTWGHDSGDALLQQVALRLQGTLREMDTVARLGGDEFAVLLPATDDDGAEHAAAKIVSALARTIMVDGRALSARASIGIASRPMDGGDGATLLRHADIAMYGAKRRGGGYALYRSLML